VQPLNIFECQTSDEIIEPGTGDEMIHFDSLPLFFSSFQIVRGNIGHILVENHSVSHEVPIEPMSQSSKALYDPIVDMMDRLCFQIQVSFIPNDLKNRYDMDMIRQFSPCPGSLEISLQNSSDKVQACPEVFEDMENTRAAPGKEVELTNS
jgi:hypothetical protein